MALFGRMHSYKMKLFGTAMAVASALLLAFHYFITPLSLVNSMNEDQHGFLFWWFTLYGLFIMAFSREKHEDERTVAVRAKSMRMALMIALGTPLAISVVTWIEEQYTFGGGDLIIVPTFCLVLYHVLFNIGLHFDHLWDYGEDNVPATKVKKTSWHYLIYISLIAILLGLMVYETIATR